MTTALFYDSSVYDQSLAASIIFNAYPSVTIFDTKGLNTASIGTQIGTLSAASQDIIWVIADVGANPPAGTVTAGQVTTLDTKLIGAPGDTTCRVIAADNGGTWPTLKYRPLIAWENVYPTTIPPQVVKCLGGFNLWDELFTGTATSGTSTTLVDSGATFGTSATSGTASGGTFTTLVDTGAGWTVDAYVGQWLTIYGGTNAGEAFQILSNTTDTITIDGNFSAYIDNTSTYYIMDVTLKGSYCKIVGGTNDGEIRLITASAARSVFVDSAYLSAIDNTSDYEIISYNNVNDALLDYYFPLYLMTYLQDATNANYKKLIDNKQRLGQSGNGSVLTQVDESYLASVILGGKTIYDYLNI